MVFRAFAFWGFVEERLGHILFCKNYGCFDVFVGLRVQGSKGRVQFAVQLIFSRSVHPRLVGPTLLAAYQFNDYLKPFFSNYDESPAQGVQEALMQSYRPLYDLYYANSKASRVQETTYVCFWTAASS